MFRSGAMPNAHYGSRCTVDIAALGFIMITMAVPLREPPLSHVHLSHRSSTFNGRGYDMAQIFSNARPERKTEPHGGTNGWSALSRMVREVDEGKIRDCKEDIDTLLVFAGLFSAVMTAFIIESYKALQQDPATIGIQLLQQIVVQFQTQGCTQDSATATQPSSSLSYEPPTWAIRVNILWFASLILSLTTASLGMLVKQWLREYLGGEYVGPRTRLRIRHFRSPGLSRWKVFEVAAILPLLLQISLGLFFVGLCFFTSAVHTSIGHTSLPLVAGWSTFLLITTVLPVFSSRCPYKSPFLKEYLGKVRPRFHYWWMRGKWFAFAAIKAILRFVTSNAGGYTSGLMHLPNFPCLETDEDEEAYRVMTNSLDVAVLGAVDELLLDDDILDTTIVECLHENELDGRDTIGFLLEAIVRRDPHIEKDRYVRLPADLQQLTPRAWNAIVQTALEALEQKIQDDNLFGWEPWIENSILLLLSLYSSWRWESIAIKTSKVFRVALAGHRDYFCGSIAAAHCFGNMIGDNEQISGRLLKNFDAVFKHLDDEELEFSCLEEIVGRRKSRFEYQPGSVNFATYLSSPWGQVFTAENLRDLAEVMVAMLQRQLEKAASPWMPWMTDAVSFVAGVMGMIDDYTPDGAPIGSSRSVFAQGFCSLLIHPDASHIVFASLSQLAPASFAGGSFVINALQGLYQVESRSELALSHFNDFLSTSAVDALSPIRLINLAIRMIRLPEALSCPGLRRKSFSILATLLVQNRDRYPDDDYALGEACMLRIHALECHNADFSYQFFIPLTPDPFRPDDDSYFPLDDESSYLKWRHSFDEAKSFFPDDFVYALSTIARQEIRWYRVRRLKEIGY